MITHDYTLACMLFKIKQNFKLLSGKIKKLPGTCESVFGTGYEYLDYIRKIEEPTVDEVWEIGADEKYIKKADPATEKEVDEAAGVGKRYDDGKPPVVAGFINYFPRAIEAVAFVSKYGADKYELSFADKNWQRLSIERLIESGPRHLIGQCKGETYDPESKLLHAAHEAWNAMAKLEKILETHSVREDGS